MFLRGLFILGLITLPIQADAAQRQDKNFGGIVTTVWMPATPMGLLPVIVFSHGFNGCNTQSLFLTEGLADAGYVVVAPNHGDARCGSSVLDTSPKDKMDIKGSLTAKAKEKLAGKFKSKDVPLVEAPAATGTSLSPSFAYSERWDDRAYASRRAEIETVLNAALRDPVIGKVMDRRRMGLAGYGLGGYTALGLAGAWPSWKDQRFGAVLALAPYVVPYVAKGSLGNMNVPVMYQGGTQDFEMTPSVSKEGGAYEKSSSPKYYVEFDKGGPFGWTNRDGDHHAMMLKYSRLFFDQVLKAQVSPALGKKALGVSDLRVMP